MTDTSEAQGQALAPPSCSLFLGDCLDVMARLEDGSINAIITDLPYGTTACKWDAVIPFSPMWEQVRRLLKTNGVFVTTASQPFTSALVMSNPNMFKHEWVWIKNRGSNFANTVREPMKEHESVLVFSQGKWTYNRQMQPRAESGLARAAYGVEHNDQDRETYRKFEGRARHTISELRVPSSWQKFNIAAGKEKTKHPTQKPLELMRYMVRTYTNPGDVVLDPCMGSGTTCLAAKLEGRGYIGIEREPKYFEKAKTRIEGDADLFSANDQLCSNEQQRLVSEVEK